MTHTLVRRRYADDYYVPARGCVIKVHLPEPIGGPGSVLGSRSAKSTTTSVASWRAHPKVPHYAIVRVALPDPATRTVHISVWPVPAYSAARPSSTVWMSSQPQRIRDHHLPVPYHASDPDPRPTPTAFGEPLTAGGYRDRRPSWVLMEMQTFQLSYRRKWRSFEPPVIIPPAEMERIELYHHVLSAPPPSPQVLLMHSPPASPVEHDLFSRIFGDATVLPLADDDSDPEVEEEVEEEEADVYTYLQGLALGSRIAAEMVEEHDREEAENRRGKVLGWMEEVGESGVEGLGETRAEGVGETGAGGTVTDM